MGAGSGVFQANSTRSYPVNDSRKRDTLESNILTDLLGSPSLDVVRGELEATLSCTIPILVLEESGTGKTALAHAIAATLGRRPVVRVLLGASDDVNTISSELFGHVRGAYSGAHKCRTGLVEHANGGVLVLDEILNLPLQAQRLLLDFTQFGTYRPLGYDKATPKQADVRLIGVTNGDVAAAVRRGQFREDLFHRLAGTVLTLPPLRVRQREIPAIADRILRSLGPECPLGLSTPLRQILSSSSYAWPGNIRELETLMVKARHMALRRDPGTCEIIPDDLGRHDVLRPFAESAVKAFIAPFASTSGDLGSAWRDISALRECLRLEEEKIIRSALDEAKGIVATAARMLGIPRTTLASRIAALEIHANRPGSEASISVRSA